MLVIESYALAVGLCILTMICWGSWANTQKLASKEWKFQLFYWDYALGVVLFSVILAFTAGSMGEAGRSFVPDLAQADTGSLWSAFLGGVLFNLSNILLVAAIDIAGIAVAFPVGVGLALVLGVITNYLGAPTGDPILLFGGVSAVAIAIVLDALAYRRLAAQASRPSREGIVLSIAAGVLMGFFYRFVAASMSTDPVNLESGQLSPYSAVFIFSLGLFASNFLFNVYAMRRPFRGEPVSMADYFRNGTPRLHAVGILGGVIWNLGMSSSIVASGAAGFAISYGLGQGATLVAALWGVFIWKEFDQAKERTRGLITAMFLCYVIGLGMIILSRFV